jgi:anaerobic magnesium-protoporphyrin IX monomethyl ester cyclase
MHVHLAYVGDPGGTDYPLALYLLRGYAQADPFLRDRVRFSLTIFPCGVDPVRAAREIRAGDPDLVALSCYVWNVDTSLALCGALKRVAPGVPIVLGGPEVSPLAREILEGDTGADIVVSGEGEETFRALLHALAGSGGTERVDGARRQAAGSLGKIAGITYRSGDAVVANPPRTPIADLEDLPPLFEDRLSDTIAGHRAVLYETFRGCPYVCSFCEWSDPGANGRLRLVPIDRVLDDIRVILGASVRELFFIDSAINFLPDRARRILETIEDIQTRTGTRTMIGVHVWVERITDELCELLARTGVRVLVGLQTFGDGALIEANRRWFRRDRFEAGVERLLRHGVNLYSIQIIYGLPLDGHAQFRENVAWVLDRRVRIWCGPLMLLPGTDYALRARELGIKADPVPPYEVKSARGYGADEMSRSHDLAAGVDFYNRTSPGAVRRGATLLGLSPVDFLEELGRWWRRRDGGGRTATRLADLPALLAFVDRRLRDAGRSGAVDGALRDIIEGARALRHA